MIPRTRPLLLARIAPSPWHSPLSVYLFRRPQIYYTSAMGEGIWIVAAVIGVGVVYLIDRLIYRRWVAGRLADDLLREVVKGKDAFRR